MLQHPPLAPPGLGTRPGGEQAGQWVPGPGPAEGRRVENQTGAHAKVNEAKEAKNRWTTGQSGARCRRARERGCFWGQLRPAPGR